MEEHAEPSDEAERLAAGDSLAWEAFYGRIYPKMMVYAENRLGRGEAAKDAVSEALARTVRSIVRAKETKTAADAWAFGVLRHVVTDFQRASYKTIPAKAITLGADGVDEGLLVSEERQQLLLAFSTLNDQERDILELRVVAGLGSEEVGGILNMTAGAVRMAQARALAKLRTRMEEGDNARV